MTGSKCTIRVAGGGGDGRLDGCVSIGLAGVFRTVLVMEDDAAAATATGGIDPGASLLVVLVVVAVLVLEIVAGEVLVAEPAGGG